MIKAMKFVSIPTRDQQKALEFYTRATASRGCRTAALMPEAARRRPLCIAAPTLDLVEALPA